MEETEIMVLIKPFTSGLLLSRSQFATPKILALQVLGLGALHTRWKRKSEKCTPSQISHRPKALAE